jgi:hypothetical protein
VVYSVLVLLLLLPFFVPFMLALAIKKPPPGVGGGLFGEFEGYLSFERT